jgi:hypothetical protein
VCRGRSNACNPLAPRIDKNLGNPVAKKVWVRTLADRRGIRLLSVNTTIVMFIVYVMKELCYLSWISPWLGILQHTVLTLIPSLLLLVLNVS